MRLRLRVSLTRFVTGQIVAGLLVGIAASANGPGDLNNNNNDEAEIVRLIGGAEESYFHVNRRYATFPELLKSGFLEQTAVLTTQHLSAFRMLNLQSEAAPLAGFALALVVAPDRASYRLSLTPNSQTCATGWVTDESGDVREGKSIDCEPASTPSPDSRSSPAVQPLPAAPLSLPWGPPDIDEAVPPARTDAPCPLPQILEETSKHTQAFVETLQSFSASERIEWSPSAPTRSPAAHSRTCGSSTAHPDLARPVPRPRPPPRQLRQLPTRPPTPRPPPRPDRRERTADRPAALPHPIQLRLRRRRRARARRRSTDLPRAQRPLTTHPHQNLATTLHPRALPPTPSRQPTRPAAAKLTTHTDVAPAPAKPATGPLRPPCTHHTATRKPKKPCPLPRRSENKWQNLPTYPGWGYGRHAATAFRDAACSAVHLEA